MVLQVDRQAREVVGLLGAANGFRQVTSGQKGIAARRVVSQVLHSLSKLGDALGGVLPSQIYVQAAGQVLQALLETVVGRAGISMPAGCCLSQFTFWCCLSHAFEILAEASHRAADWMNDARIAKVCSVYRVQSGI